MARLDRFDPFLPAQPWRSPWRADGSFEVDGAMLRTLLGVAVGTAQTSGTVAGAVDVWVAEELRRAGFDPDEVCPRRTEPRVLPRDLHNFVELALPQQLCAQVKARYTSPGARRALPAEAHVMGSAFSKQADVVVASWSAGVELLVSTKKMLSSYQKNLRNRFEEGYGDAKNLRGRHPLAALGFVFVDIPDARLAFTIDMLRKLTAEPDVYDGACLLVVEGAAGVPDEPVDDARDADDEPPALLSLPVRETPADSLEPEPAMPPVSGQVSVLTDLVPPDLGAGSLFRTLIERALAHMPLAVYPVVRARRDAAMDRSPSGAA